MTKLNSFNRALDLTKPYNMEVHHMPDPVLTNIKKYENEKQFRDKLLEPLFQYMGFETMKNHGVQEFGKDFVLVKFDEFGVRRYTGVVVKNGDIGNSGVQIDDISRQLREVFTLKYLDSMLKQSVTVERAYFVCSGTISDNAKRKIVEQWGASCELHERNTVFLTSENLVRLVDLHWPKQDDKYHDIKEEWLSDRVGAKLQALKDNVKNIILSSNVEHGDPESFTIYNEGHCKAVENWLHRLIPSGTETEFIEKERFYLLALAWLHDLGMSKTVAHGILGGHDVSYTDIRESHHDTVKKYLSMNYKKFGLDDRDADILIQICYNHRKYQSIYQIDECIQHDDDDIKTRLIGAYLKLADILDTGNKRSISLPYSIFITNGITPETTYFWIKSKCIRNIALDHRKRVISITINKFRFQNDDDANSKMDQILTQIKEELLATFNDVRQVLMDGGISWFVDMLFKEIPAEFTDISMYELKQLLRYYDIVEHPSASKLFEIIASSFALLSRYELVKNAPPTPLKISTEWYSLDNVKFLVNRLKKELLPQRKCHTSLRFIIDFIDKNFQEEGFIEKLDYIYQQHHKSREMVRQHASAFYSSSPAEGDTTTPLRILVYGFSELVIKALCGIRDSIILSRKSDIKLSETRGDKEERDASDQMEIFICECQPKTQVSPFNNLLYHDGYQYAKQLRKRLFTKLILVPDIVVNNVIKSNHIDLVLVGANGYDDASFKHSAGHSTVISSVKSLITATKLPAVVLVVSSEKFVEKFEDDPMDDARSVTIDGYRFWPGSIGSLRRNIWVVRDKSRTSDLNDAIYYLNPKEDVIPISDIDFVVSDTGYYEISPKVDRNGHNKLQFISDSLKRKEVFAVHKPKNIRKIRISKPRTKKIT
jgi:hypothetical protein